MIGAKNPKASAVKIVTTCLLGSDSKVKVNVVKMIKVNDGGTNNVEINLASLCEENKFNIMVSNYTLIKLNIPYCHTESRFTSG